GADTLERVVQLARRGLALERTQAAAAARISHLQDQLEAATDEVDELRQRLEDEQLEVALAVSELDDAQRLARHLRGLLNRTDLAGEVWSSPEPDGTEVAPDSFTELLDRASSLPRLVLGLADEDAARELDNFEHIGVWAAKTWQALLARRDYARLTAEGAFNGDVAMYLANTPPDCCSFSVNRHARDESESVRNNPALRAPRVLPVPDHVDPSGRVFMGAHFRIANSGRTSPRMHYYDATAIDGNVYVGYIGRHLPISSS